MTPNGFWIQELERLESVRQQTLELIDNLSQNQIDFKVSPSTWSVGEIIDHILLAERLYRGEILELIGLAREGRRPRLRRSFSDVDVSLFFIPKSVLPLLEIPFTVFNYFVPAAVREMLTRYTLIPAKNPAQAEPRKGRPLEELVRDLRSSMQQTRTLFDSNSDLDFSGMVHEHPLMGVNSVPQLLRFISKHELRHQEQIRRAISSFSPSTR